MSLFNLCLFLKQYLGETEIAQVPPSLNSVNLRILAWNFMLKISQLRTAFNIVFFQNFIFVEVGWDSLCIPLYCVIIVLDIKPLVLWIIIWHLRRYMIVPALIIVIVLTYCRWYYVAICSFCCNALHQVVMTQYIETSSPDICVCVLYN